jgi:hypothetical protein
MRIAVAFCAVLVCVGCDAAQSAPARTNVVPSPFDEVAPRPPGSIPHVRPPHAAAAAPLPRPKPDQAPTPMPAAAPAPGAPVFPPVAPLE